MFCAGILLMNVEVGSDGLNGRTRAIFRGGWVNSGSESLLSRYRFEPASATIFWLMVESNSLLPEFSEDGDGCGWGVRPGTFDGWK